MLTPDYRQIEASRRILKQSQRELGPYNIVVAGLEFVVLPGVFSPKYFDSTGIFAERFPYRKEEAFLEIGCGTGVMSVLGGLNGCHRVLAVDINSMAVKNTRVNAQSHGLEGRLEARESDIFSAVNSTERFNTIYWNTNFIYIEPTYVHQSVLERSLYDPGYRNLHDFLRQAPPFLVEGGRLVVGFADIGDTHSLFRLCQQYGYHIREYAHGAGAEGRPVIFTLYELTR